MRRDLLRGLRTTIATLGQLVQLRLRQGLQLIQNLITHARLMLIVQHALRIHYLVHLRCVIRLPLGLNLVEVHLDLIFEGLDLGKPR